MPELKSSINSTTIRLKKPSTKSSTVVLYNMVEKKVKKVKKVNQKDPICSF